MKIYAPSRSVSLRDVYTNRRVAQASRQVADLPRARKKLFSKQLVVSSREPVIISLYFVIPFLTLVAVAEATMLPAMRIGNTQPDLTLLVVGAWSLRRGIEEGAVWAFIGGLVLSLLSAGPFPVAVFGLLVVSLVLGFDPTTGAGRRQSRPFGGNPVALIVGVILATLTFHAVILAALQLVGRPLDLVDAAARVIAPRALFNLVLIPFIYRALGWLDRRTRREEFVL